MSELLNFFVNGYFFQNGVILLQFQALRSIFLVLGRDIPTGPGFPAGLMLGALQNHLNPTSFLCHNWTI